MLTVLLLLADPLSSLNWQDKQMQVFSHGWEKFKQ